MKDMGMAIMGTGRSSGEDRARQAALQAINSPILENANIEGARGVLINITGNDSLGLQEIHEAASVIHDLVSEDANIILGSVIDRDVADEVIVTVIATGFDSNQNRPLKSSSTHSSSNYPYSQSSTLHNTPQRSAHQSLYQSRNTHHTSPEQLDTPTFMRTARDNENTPSS
jgi:cell division protein FtsZ